MKKKLLKNCCGVVMAVVLMMGVVGVEVYGNELFGLYNMFFREYTIKGTIVQTNYFYEGTGILVELDNPIESELSLFPISTVFIKNQKGTVGQRFEPQGKFQMMSMENEGFNVIGILSPSIGSVSITPPSNTYTTEESDEMLDWLTSYVEGLEPMIDESYDYLNNDSNEIYVMDGGSMKDDEIYDPTLLRLYDNNSQYMYFEMLPPAINEFTGEVTYEDPIKKIAEFKNNGKTFFKNDTYYFPLRDVMEYYGHTVDWVPENSIIISGFITVYLNSNKIISRNTEITLSNPAEIIDGVTYVSLDFLEKAIPENKFTWTVKNRENGMISIDITQEIAG